MNRFYDLKQDATGIPAGDRPFEPGAFGWIADALKEQTDEGDPENLSLTCSVRGVSCIGCVWLIEKVFMREDGALRAAVDPGRATATFTWDPSQLNIEEFAGNLAKFGYTLRPEGESVSGDKVAEGSPGTRLGLCGALALNTMGFTLPRYLGMEDDFFLANLFELITIVSATLCFLIGGTWFIGRAVAALRNGVLHIDLPIALGITAAYVASIAGWLLGAERLLYADFVATFTFLMLAGRHLHLLASRRFQNQAADESNLTGTVENAKAEGGQIPIHSLEKDDQFLIASGGVLPVAGRLVSPNSAAFSLAWMTGEPDPVSYRPPTVVPAGARNLGQEAVQVTAVESWSESLVAKLTEEEDSKRGRSTVLETVLRIYLFTVLAVATLGAGSWLMIAGGIPALEVFIAILVISCPCAIGVALPLVDQRGAYALQRVGVFVRNPEVWGKLRRVRHILFDKTGTVTLERPVLVSRDALKGLGKSERDTLASMVSGSLHPLSRSLAEELAALGSPINPDLDTQETPGVGLQLLKGEADYKLTKPIADDGPRNQAVCEFTRNGRPLATFRFEEEARPSTEGTLRTLSKFGLDTTIVSGDAPDRVTALGRTLGLSEDSIHGGLSPVQKAELVKEMGEDCCLFVGDGGNDSLAFDAALISGAPAARDSLLQDRADFVFTGRGLDFIPSLFRIAHWRSITVRMVLILSVLYNIAAVSLCLAGMMNPLLAAILMPISSIATLLVAARRRPRASNLPDRGAEKTGRLTPLSLPPLPS